VNSKNSEDWEENFCQLNLALGKVKSHRQLDPAKLSKATFTINFEFLQFLFDLIAKNFGDPFIKGYKGYQKRIDVIKTQSGGKFSNYRMKI